MAELIVSLDPTDICFETLCNWLGEAYWSNNRSKETINRSVTNSICATALLEGRMVGFARVVTDRATFAWLCDVYVDPEMRGRGIGKELVQTMMENPELADVRWMLGTRDAHSLYEQFGFESSSETDRWMTKGFMKRPS